MKKKKGPDGKTQQSEVSQLCTSTAKTQAENEGKFCVQGVDGLYHRHPPKKPFQPYQIFSAFMKDKLIKKNPDAPLGTIMKAIQMDWNRMPPYRKRYFYKQASDQKLQYE